MSDNNEPKLYGSDAPLFMNDIMDTGGEKLPSGGNEGCGCVCMILAIIALIVLDIVSRM